MSHTKSNIAPSTTNRGTYERAYHQQVGYGENAGIDCTRTIALGRRFGQSRARRQQFAAQRRPGHGAANVDGRSAEIARPVDGHKDDKDDSSANQIQQQLVKLAADNAL